MFQPLNDRKVLRAVHFVPLYEVLGFKFLEPALHEGAGVVIVGVEKAREHSRGRASPASVVNYCPNLDEKQPSIAG